MSSNTGNRAFIPPWQLHGSPASGPTLTSTSPTRAAPTTAPKNPPPVPPRTAFPPAYSNAFHHPFAPYDAFGVSAFNAPYSSPFYGPFDRNFGLDPNGPFAQLAHRNALPGLDSVADVVRAVHSVSVTIDSAYRSVHATVCAALGMADQFTKIKDGAVAILSSLASLRFLKWLLDLLKTFLGIRLRGSTTSAATDWTTGFRSSLSASDESKPRSVFPWLALIGFLIGTPWLLKRFVLTPPRPGSSSWASGTGEHYVAKAEYDYVAKAEDELSFKSGDFLRVAPKEAQLTRAEGWLLTSSNGVKTGLVPANYVSVLVKREGDKKR